MKTSPPPRPRKRRPPLTNKEWVALLAGAMSLAAGLTQLGVEVLKHAP